MTLHVAPYGRDDGLLEEAAVRDVIAVRVYVPADISVVLGHGSRAEIELRVESCLADGVPILRRSGGGCAVVLDPGNVVVAAAMRADGAIRVRERFAAFSGWLLDGLASLGLGGLRREGASDIASGDRKVGGACLYRSRDLWLYGATLLVDPRVDLMDRYLAHPPREPEWRRGRSHADFVGRLADLPGSWTATRLAASLRERLPIGISDGAPDRRRFAAVPAGHSW